MTYKLARGASHINKIWKKVAGNLDFPLSIGKDNYFGTFTESFDIMREELKKAREGQARAEHAKHEMMAELSHDIRTPLATINATPTMSERMISICPEPSAVPEKS